MLIGRLTLILHKIHFMFKQLFFLFSLSVICCNLRAQSNNTSPGNISPEVRITGYLQFQYQKASAPGISSFSGGDFADNNDSRFIIRRGRLRFDRSDKITNIVLSVDATQDGIILKDGFIQIKDPWSGSFMLTAGQFNRPFGYIVSYSSSLREVPERPRVFQTVLASERDIGAMLTIQLKNIKFLQYDISILNGSGPNARDYDSKKDLCTSLKLNFNTSKIFNAGFGFSYYNGFVRQKTTTNYINSLVSGKPGFIAQTSAGIEGSYAKREYTGINLQLEHHNVLGKISLKAEYLTGQQPGIAPSASVKAPLASRSFSAQPATDIYTRKFNGYFIWFVKDIPKTPLELVADYDSYDPNTFVHGSDIGVAGSNTTAADIRYKTFGGGIEYYISPQVKFTGYYEHPVNEKTVLSGYTGDISDNVFTLRAQYRF
jgi:hypothetical protein